MLRVLTLSPLFPDASRPNFGIFVERKTRGVAELPDVAVRVVAPLGIPPWPLSRLARYRALSALPHEEQWRGLHLYRPRFRTYPGTGGRYNSASLARAVAPLLERIRVDFPFDLIAAEFFHPDGPAAVALGRRFGVPVCITARGSDIHRSALSPALTPQILAAARAADGMIAVSNALRDDMIALGMPATRIRCIVNGVDLARFAPRDRAAAKAGLGAAPGPLVVSLGALTANKGHELVIDAVARLPGVALWIAGEGDERPRLAARIAKLGVGDRVRLLGSVLHEQIPALLAAADAMALASGREGLANAWLEALASGTPIVIPDIGGARQVLRDDSAGRIVPRTADAISAALAGLIADPPAPARVRAAAEPFTWAANSASVHGFYRELIAARRV